ncbi:ankyrin repeat-containing domain protein [Aspergillus recurvatus]
MGWCRGLGMYLCALSLLVVLLGSWLAMRFPELEAPLETLAHTSEEEPLDWRGKPPDTALCESCKRNNTAVVQVLLENPHVDVDAAPRWDTPLFLAALHNEPDVIKLLLDHGADPKIRSRDNTAGLSAPSAPASLSPLHGLGRRANLGNQPDRDERLIRGASLLLEAGADANAVDHWGSIPLHGCLHSPARYVERLLDRVADPNAQNYDGSTPMHFFFNLEEQPEDLELLMAHGARLDVVRSVDGLTPLHAYVQYLNNLAALRPYVSGWGVTDAEGNTLLHQAVASHGVGKKGCQAIHMICSSSVSQEVLDMLLPAGAGLEARDYQGRTLLARLTSGYPQYDYYQLIAALICNGAGLNTQDHSGNGVLTHTIRPDALNFVYFNYLLSIGADPHIINNNGDTLLHLLAAKFAAVAENTVLNAMIKLIGLGVSPTQTNHQGRTPLHMLCSQISQHMVTPSVFGRKAAIDLALDTGLIDSLNKPDNDGVLPIHRAATVSEDLVRKLISRGADATAATKDGRALLHIAATARQSNVVGLLLDHYRAIGKLTLAGADVNAVDQDNKWPLTAELFARLGGLMTEAGWINKCQGFFSREAETIKVIVGKFGADVDRPFPEGAKVIPDVRVCSVVYANREYEPGDTALHYLAQGGHWWHKEAITYLLQHGADPNAGITETTRLLLEGGADPNIPASCELVKLLLAYGARPSPDHPAELFSALDSYKLDVVELLLDTGLDPNPIILTDTQPHWHLQRFPNPKNASGKTVRPLGYISMRPFNEAHARNRVIELIKYLLGKGADPHLSSSVTPTSILHYIFTDGGVIQPYLERDDLDLERRDPDGRTLLIAHRSRNVPRDPTRAMTLYERGADLTATDNMGNNIIHLLVEHDCKDRGGLADPHCETERRRTVSLFLEKAPQLATQKNKGWLRRTPLAKRRL